MTTTTRSRIANLFRPKVIPAPRASWPASGMSFTPWREIGLFQQMAGASSPLPGAGYHTEGDVLVTRTVDNVDINTLWAEFQATLQIFNEGRDALVALFTYPVSQLVESVPQGNNIEFERASEFGVPKAVRPKITYFQMAYDFEDYDLATRYTWKFLRDVDARQLRAVHNAILEADNALLFRKVMEAIFDNRTRVADIQQSPFNVYPLYNGDATVPPQWKNTVHTAPHTHYLVSGAVLIDSGDLEDAYTHLSHHGFSVENRSTVVVMANSAQTGEIRKFRAGVVNNNGITANYDFIPAPNQPAMIVPNSDGLLGTPPPATWNGLPVIGSYRSMMIIEEDYIPAGYTLTFASGGPGNINNLVGFREHANTDYRGLRLLPGNQQSYPLIDGFYARAFGTGIRQRGAAVVTQYKAPGTYDIPASFTAGGGYR